MSYKKIYLITKVPGVTHKGIGDKGSVLRFTSSVRIGDTESGEKICSTMASHDYFRYINWFAGCSFKEFKRRSL